MDRYILVISSFGFAVLVWAVSLVNSMIYFVKLRRLLKLLRERWPEKSMELGEPKLFTFKQSMPQNAKAITSFIRNPGIVNDVEIASILKQLKPQLILSKLGIVVPVIFVLLGVFLMIRGM